jgi:pimeloyl-ACP methyl ester carboxylesterase
MFDYGSAEKNKAVYGTVTPPDMFEHFDLIDLPIHFLCGSEDTLIPPEDVLVQFEALHRFHPDKAVLHLFERVSHLSFTYGQDEALISYMRQYL